MIPVYKDYNKSEKDIKITRNLRLKTETQKERDNIFEYNGENNKIKKYSRDKIDTNKNYRGKSKNEINNKINNSIGYFLKEEKKIVSLNKGKNTNSSTIINNKLGRGVEIKMRNIYNNTIRNNKINQISGFELYYESDKRNKINTIHKFNEEKNIKKIFNKDNNNNYISSINLKRNNNYIFNNKSEMKEYIINNKNNNNFKTIQKKNEMNNKINISSINKKIRVSKNKIKIINKNTINNISIRNKLNINIKSFRNFHRPSEIKKIILIQKNYRAHLSHLKFSEYMNKLRNYKNLFKIINYIIIEKKKVILNYIKFVIKENKNRNKSKNRLMNTNNKILIKTNEINMLHKELVDSFNIKNDDLIIKLDDIIKENKDLKNQIFENKIIEDKMKKLLEENKKNQSINEIIMKDNRQLSQKLKDLQDNRNNQLIIQYQLPINLVQIDDIQTKLYSKLKYLYLKYIFFKKVLKNKNSLRIYFNKFRNNIKLLKNKYTIENNNIFINNKKNINIQMVKNLNINYISENDNYKYILLSKLFIKKEQIKVNIISKYFYKYYYICNYINKEIEEDINIKKRRILKAIINKKEKKDEYIIKNKIKEWKLRGKIFKMKGAAKELKKKKKLKKKIRDKIAKATLNNLKNKTANFQNTHEFSYKIEKTIENDDKEEKKENDDIQLESEYSI